MEEVHSASADAFRARLARGPVSRDVFRASLVRVPPSDRDAWVDRLLGLEVPDDGPHLPRGCVPYLPSSVDVLIRAVEAAAVDSSDVFVDVGAGVGRALAVVHLLTGASAVGVEVQPDLVAAARALTTRLRGVRLTFLEGDAETLDPAARLGSVFFLYCPFSGDRLERFLAQIEPEARARPLRIVCVDLPLPRRTWLTPTALPPGDVVVHRSTA